MDHVRRLGSHPVGGELPRRDWIDEVTPENPVWVYRLDGHMALANSAALELAGVDADTADIDGGTIVRYEDGRPTGLLKDNAMTFVESAIPEAKAAQLDREARAAMEHVAANGVTSVHDMAGWSSLLPTGARKAGRIAHSHLFRRTTARLGATSR